MDNTTYINDTELIQKVYSSLTDKHGFHSFLETLSKTVDASACTLSCIQRKPISIRSFWETGLPQGFVDEFLLYGMVERDIVFNLSVKKTLTNFSSASDALREIQQYGNADQWAKNYEASMRMGYHQAFWMVIHAKDDYVVVLSLLRKEDQEQYTALELEKVSRLTPHIRHAFQLYEEINKISLQASSLGAVLNALPKPSLIISDLNQVIYANKSAKDMMTANATVNIVDDKLQINDPLKQTLFSSQLLEVLKSSIGITPYFSTTLYLTRENQADLILCVNPIENIDQHRAGALITILDPEQRYLPNAERIGKYYSLTPAEGVLCEDLVAGKNIKDIASSRHKSEATLRSYLKNIYEKTGCNRQGQLISMILSALID